MILLCIYLVFIGLGLSDSLLGAAWPFMASDFFAETDWAGTLSFIISLGIIAASLNAWRLTRRLGTAKTAALGLGLIAVALLGFAGSHEFLILCLCCVPLGLGGGLIQTVFDNYVAGHYSARHMNWLQGSWGIGAVAGPYLVSVFSQGAFGWRGSYVMIAMAEIAVLLFMYCRMHNDGSRGAYKERKDVQTVHNKAAAEKRLREKAVNKRRGTPFSLKRICMGAQFFCYCSVENAVMLWGASYLIYAKAFDASMAARGVSMFFLGITAGRFLSGFVANRLGNISMIGCSVGAAVIMDMILLSTRCTPVICIVFLLLGMSMAPVFPTLLHQTPACFPGEDLNLLMGIQVACAYVGITVVPPVLGKLFAAVSFSLLPLIQLIFLMIVLGCVAFLNVRRGK